MSTTVFALATPAGRSGVAIFRISGPRAGVLRAITQRDLPKPRVAVTRRIFRRPLTPALSRKGERGFLRRDRRPSPYRGARSLPSPPAGEG